MHSVMIISKKNTATNSSKGSRQQCKQGRGVAGVWALTKFEKRVNNIGGLHKIEDLGHLLQTMTRFLTF